MESGQNLKWWKFKVVASGQKLKWSKRSGQNEKWCQVVKMIFFKLKVAKMERGQNK